MTNKKGFIFDLDGTLALSQDFHYQAYARVFKEYGIDYSKEEDQTVYAGKGAEKTFKAVFNKHGKPLTANEVYKFALKKRELYHQMINGTDVDEVPGIKKFLKTSLKSGIKIIIATGSRIEATKTILKKTGLEKFFDKIVTNPDVKNSKPAPDIFLKAASELGLSPEECIAFEDATMGILAAKAANMYCIGLATTLDKDELKKAGADMTVNDYNELMQSDFFN